MAFSLITSNDLIFSIALGFLPVLLWLLFWLKKDPHPEPRSILILIFLGGMAAVLFAFVFEFSLVYLGKIIPLSVAGGVIVLLLWALIEEILKFLAAKYTAFKRKSFDEPADAVIYMVTAALGFASVENILFILGVCQTDGMLIGFITGNLRFFGATILHTASSAVVGASIGFTFFHKEHMKRNIIGGIFLATLLHFAFNYFIIQIKGQGMDSLIGMFNIFIPLWLIIIIIFFIFEKVKRVKSNQ